MFFKKREVRMRDLPIDEVVFAPEDLFVLLGGFDPAMFACNPFTMDLDRLAAERPDRGEWLRRTVGRYGPGGLVDADGEPCPELACALAPLKHPEIVIADGPGRRSRTTEERTVELAVADGRATALVSERSVLMGRVEGFRLVPLGTDRGRWGAWLAEHKETDEMVADADISFRGVQVLDASGTGEGMAEGNIITAITQRDQDAIDSWARAAGADPDAFARAARAIANPLVWPATYIVKDFRGCTFEQMDGIDLPSHPRGPFRMRQMSFYCQGGVDLSICSAPRPGYPADWIEREGLKTDSGFIVVNFYQHTPLIDALTQTFAHPASAGAGADAPVGARG